MPLPPTACSVLQARLPCAHPAPAQHHCMTPTSQSAAPLWTRGPLAPPSQLVEELLLAALHMFPLPDADLLVHLGGWHPGCGEGRRQAAANACIMPRGGAGCIPRTRPLYLQGMARPAACPCCKPTLVSGLPGGHHAWWLRKLQSTVGSEGVLQRRQQACTLPHSLPGHNPPPPPRPRPGCRRLHHAQVALAGGPGAAPAGSARGLHRGAPVPRMRGIRRPVTQAA